MVISGEPQDWTFPDFFAMRELPILKMSENIIEIKYKMKFIEIEYVKVTNYLDKNVKFWSTWSNLFRIFCFQIVVYGV